MGRHFEENSFNIMSDNDIDIDIILVANTVNTLLVIPNTSLLDGYFKYHRYACKDPSVCVRL